MRQEIWASRAASLAPLIGNGLTVSEIARMVGLSRQTVKAYIQRFELDRGETVPKPKDGVLFKDRLADIRRCASEGKTRKETAELLDLSINTVSLYARQYGVEFIHASSVDAVHDAARAEAMAAMYSGGKTLAEIGSLYGLTRERVRQIIKKRHGLTAKDGGLSKRTERARSSREAKRDAKTLEKYGCTYRQYRGLVRIGTKIKSSGGSTCKTPTGAWHSQRRNAIRRGIEWNISLWDWWTAWQKSGKWEQRGKKAGDYVMCRFGDVGAYEVGNVYIATASHNCSVQPNHPRRRKNLSAAYAEARA